MRPFISFNFEVELLFHRTQQYPPQSVHIFDRYSSATSNTRSLNDTGVAGAVAAVAKLPCKYHFEIVIGIYVRVLQQLVIRIRAHIRNSRIDRFCWVVHVAAVRHSRFCLFAKCLIFRPDAMPNASRQSNRKFIRLNDCQIIRRLLKEINR